MRVIYGVLTVVFAITVIVAVVSVFAFIGLTAYDVAPGSDDRPPSPGVLLAHPEVMHLAMYSTGAAVFLAIVLAILDRVLDR